METKQASSRRIRQIAAIAAGVLVVGVAASYTLASWNDSEWVWGGASGNPGVGTSTFEVQQNTAFADDPDAWADEEQNPGGGLTFTTGALALSPGDTVFAPVALRTVEDSVAGHVELQGAVEAAGVTVQDTGNALWNAIRVSVYTAAGAAPPAACTANGVASGWTQIVSNAPFETVANAEQALAADAGSTQHYCFALTLPDGSPDSLQGRTVAPAWEFQSVSD